jgi:hypothetical protein
MGMGDKGEILHSVGIQPEIYGRHIKGLIILDHLVRTFLPGPAKIRGE